MSGVRLLAGENLSKEFAGGGRRRGQVVRAVQGVTLGVGRGEVLCLVGESGSGKSTTAAMLILLEHPTAGRVVYGGQDMSAVRSGRRLREYRRHVQMVLQDPFASLNPLQDVTYLVGRPMQVLGVAPSRAERAERVAAMLERVGLTPPAEFLHKLPHQLSGGQRQRVATARALGVGPDVLIADEPVSMLDVSLRIGILNLMLKSRDEEGLAILYITHDLASARYVGDRIAVMYAGHVVETGPTDEVLDHPWHPYTRALIAAVPQPRGQRGGEPATLLTGSAEAKADRGCPLQPRCPYRMPACAEMPAWTFDAGDHGVRCHLAGVGS